MDKKKHVFIKRNAVEYRHNKCPYTYRVSFEKWKKPIISQKWRLFMNDVRMYTSKYKDRPKISMHLYWRYKTEKMIHKRLPPNVYKSLVKKITINIKDITKYPDYKRIEKVYVYNSFKSFKDVEAYPDEYDEYSSETEYEESSSSDNDSDVEESSSSDNDSDVEESSSSDNDSDVECYIDNVYEELSEKKQIKQLEQIKERLLMPITWYYPSWVEHRDLLEDILEKEYEEEDEEYSSEKENEEDFEYIKYDKPFYFDSFSDTDDELDFDEYSERIVPRRQFYWNPEKPIPSTHQNIKDEYDEFINHVKHSEQNIEYSEEIVSTSPKKNKYQEDMTADESDDDEAILKKIKRYGLSNPYWKKLQITRRLEVFKYVNDRRAYFERNRRCLYFMDNKLKGTNDEIHKILKKENIERIYTTKYKLQSYGLLSDISNEILIQLPKDCYKGMCYYVSPMKELSMTAIIELCKVIRLYPHNTRQDEIEKKILEEYRLNLLEYRKDDYLYEGFNLPSTSAVYSSLRPPRHLVKLPSIRTHKSVPREDDIEFL